MCATYDFTVSCKHHTLEEVLRFMRTERVMKKWAFQKEGDEGDEYYRCKVSLGKSRFTDCGRLRKFQMVNLVHDFLPRVTNIDYSLYPGKWKYIINEETRVPRGGPWSSWTEDPIDEKPILRVPRIIIKSAVVKVKEVTDLTGMTISPVDGLKERVVNMSPPVRKPMKVVISIKKRPLVSSRNDETVAADNTIVADNAVTVDRDIVVDERLGLWCKREVLNSKLKAGYLYGKTN